MTDRSFRGLFFALALAGLLLDQASKYLVFQWLYNEPNETYVLAPAYFDLQGRHATEDGVTRPQVNKGALFGFLREHGTLANALFAIISVIAAGAILFWATRNSAARDWTLSAALGMILAGTLGNLYDRIVFNGVRDFLHMHWYEYEWPVFNVADSCLVCGAVLLLTQALFSRAPVEQPALELRQTVEMK